MNVHHIMVVGGRLLYPAMKFQLAWSGTQDFPGLTSSEVLLLFLVQGPHRNATEIDPLGHVSLQSL